MAEGTLNLNTPSPSYNEAIHSHDAILQVLIDMAPSLIGGISTSMIGVVESFKKVRNECQICRSPSVSMRIEELKKFMMEVVRKGRSYCDACTDLGEYASDEELIKEMDSDLKIGKLDELNEFLLEIKDYLKICETRFTRVTDDGENARKEIRKIGKDFEPKKDEALVQNRNFEAMATGFVGSAAAVCASAGPILTYFSPPASIAVIMIGIFNSGAGGSLGIDAGFSKDQIEIYTNACKSVIKLDCGLSNNFKAMGIVRKQIDDIRIGIKEKSKKSEREIEEIRSATNRLRTPLRELKEKMGIVCESSTELI